MGESRTPRPKPVARDHYERVRCFVVDRADGHRQPSARSSHVSLDRAWSGATRRSLRTHPRCMTLPQPTRRRLLPRSPYCLSSEGESRLAVASYFFLPPFNEARRHLGSHSRAAGPCRIHASPWPECSARSRFGQLPTPRRARDGRGMGAIGQRPRCVSDSSRATSRRESRSAMSRRRSCSCLPRARPTSTLQRPRPVR